jgi:hypothetical protein
LATFIVLLASHAPTRAAEQIDSRLQAAIAYLQAQVAMEILARSKCGERIPTEELGSGFGTNVFLQEVSVFLSAPQMEQIGNWVVSEKYRANVQQTATRIHEIIGTGKRGRSRCAYAIGMATHFLKPGTIPALWSALKVCKLQPKRTVVVNHLAADRRSHAKASIKDVGSQEARPPDVSVQPSLNVRTSAACDISACAMAYSSWR